MGYIAPKTNWTSNDYFSFSDYNSIKNNIQWLYDKALQNYNYFDIVPMGDDKSIENNEVYASLFNAIENNIQTINQNTVNITIGKPTREYSTNKPVLNYEELNRIETSIGLLYTALT